MKLTSLKQWFSNGAFIVSVMIVTGFVTNCSAKEARIIPIRRVIDLNIGERQTITLSDGQRVKVLLIRLNEKVDTLSSAVRSAQAVVLIDGQKIVLDVANYHLPVTVGCVQVDCPVTKAYLWESRHTRWKLQKDARLRFWPKGSPLLELGMFVYPLKQRLFANDTQMANDPVTFGVRTFRAQSGHYPARVERTDENGFKAIAHLHIEVGIHECVQK
ncbi:MAG: hypothetical protein JXM79_10155 [Sedimentisphaerales bacterium]|nr:hypothetical protein [Sedimentisphaerales bacterium]